MDYSSLSDRDLAAEIWETEHAWEQFGTDRVQFETALTHVPVPAGHGLHRWAYITSEMLCRKKWLRDHLAGLNAEHERRLAEKKAAKEKPEPCKVSSALYGAFQLKCDEFGEAYDKSPTEDDILIDRLDNIIRLAEEMRRVLQS